MAVIYTSIGDVLRLRHDVAAGVASYHDGIAILRELIKKDPSNVLWQIDLVLILYRLAEAGSDAKPNLLQALAILKQLEAAGTLPPNEKPLMATVQAALAKAS